MYDNQKKHPGTEAEPWVNLSTACKHISVASITMRRWIKEKKVTPRRTPGGDFRFRLSELDHLLEEDSRN